MPTAKEAVREIAKYIRKNFGAIARDGFIQEVRQASTLLTNKP